MRVAKQTYEASMAEVVAAYEEKGYTGQFGAVEGGMVRCYSCRQDSPAGEVHLLAAHRFEGTSDPAEEAVVMALECPHCGALGTLVLPYGPGASMEDAVVLAALLDDRGQSDLRPGT